jgi:hypothetical protein
LAERNARLETLHVAGETVEQRLVSIGVAVVQESLSEDFIGLMRLAVAEARRLPLMGSSLVRQCRERGVRPVVRLLVESVDERFWSDADDPKALQAGRLFTEAVLLPFILRALAEGDLQELRKEIAQHVKERAKFFLAGLRNDGLQG